VNARFDGREEPERSTNFEICINFSQDKLFLPTRFTSTDTERKELDSYHAYESVQLKLASEVLSAETIGKITHLVLSTTRNSSTRLYGGEGLEKFSALKRMEVLSGIGHTMSAPSKRLPSICTRPGLPKTCQYHALPTIHGDRPLRTKRKCSGVGQRSIEG
jgi:hypothetical protein